MAFPNQQFVQEAPPPQPQPYVQQPLPQPTSVYTGARRSIFGKGLILTLVLIGILLFYVGMMLVSSTTLVERPDSSDYDYSNYDEYQKDLKDYSDTVRNLLGGGRLVLEIGGLLACIGLFGGAIANEELDVRLRVTFISSGIAFIISVLVVLNLLSNWIA